MIDSTPWANRPHGGRRTVPVTLTSGERMELEQLLRLGKVERRIAVRAQAALLLADGVSGHDVATLLGVHDSTVDEWRARFRGGNVIAKLADAPRSGRPPTLSRAPNARTSSPRRAGRHAT